MEEGDVDCIFLSVWILQLIWDPSRWIELFLLQISDIEHQKTHFTSQTDSQVQKMDFSWNKNYIQYALNLNARFPVFAI